MIIARSPLRISLGGGGTDLPSFYLNHGGYVIAAAISKYVYINISKPFIDEYIIRYSKTEREKSLNNIKHPIFREALNIFHPSHNYLEISSTADVPEGTGLGSSGSFTCALLKALSTENGKKLSNRDIAEIACKIEIDILNEPIGKQDQYISAVGGITEFKFNSDNSVGTSSLNINDSNLKNLEESLLLFFTGYTRSASKILADQNKKTNVSNKDMINNLNEVKEMGQKVREVLESNNIDEFGLIMNDHWETKKKRSSGMTNKSIDNCYSNALKNGAIGGKLVGAGGGGFLLFQASNPKKLRAYMKSMNYKELLFNFDYSGTQLVAQD